MLVIKKFVTIFFSLIMLISLVSCGADEADLIDSALIFPEESTVKTINATIGNFENSVETTIYVNYDYAREFYFESDAYFKEYFVKSGDIVSAGDKILSYSTGESTVNLEEKKLELERLEEDYDRTIASYKSDLEYNKQILNALQMDSYEYKLQLLNMEKLEVENELYKYTKSNSIKNLKEQINELEDSLDIQYYYAEIDGYVANGLNFDEDDMIRKGDVALEIITYDDILLKTDDVVGFNWGTEVEIKVGNNDSAKIFSGTVIANPTILPSELGNTRCYIKVDFESLGIKASDVNFGKQSSRAFGYEEYMPNVLLLNDDTVELENGQYYVNILEDGIVKKRYISVCYGNLSDFWVVDGLEEDDDVII